MSVSQEHEAAPVSAIVCGRCGSGCPQAAVHEQLAVPAAMCTVQLSCGMEIWLPGGLGLLPAV